MLDNYFNYKKHKTDFKTEVVAGVSTFLTMAYIMFLNPVILADGGFDFGGVFTATACATALACFICAFYAKTWPVGLAPGMGINAFIAYGVCLGMEYTPAEALGAVLVAGVVFLIISLTPIMEECWSKHKLRSVEPQCPAPRIYIRSTGLLRLMKLFFNIVIFI